MNIGKKIITLLLCTAMLLSLLPSASLQAHAAEELIPYAVEGGNIYFSPEEGAITGCDPTVTAAYVPPEINGAPVKMINYSAFYDCTALTTVTLPDTITDIRDSSFEKCTGLKSIKLPNSITNIKSSVFYNCSSLETITLPESLVAIGGYAFSGCSSLKTINIPHSVIIINSSAFLNCTALETVTLPDNLQEIYASAFSGCSRLTSVTIPADVTYIAELVFWGCTKLTGIWVDEENASFCSDDKGVLYSKDKTELCAMPNGYSGEYFIPDNVDKIGYMALNGCVELTKLSISDTNPSFSTDENGVLFNKDKTELIAMPGGYTGKYSIPQSVTTLGFSAFRDCGRLEDITIPQTLRTISAYAFAGCTSLTNVQIPDTITEIEHGAFQGCSKLEQVVVSRNVARINDYVFAYCTSLTDISLPDTLEDIGWHSFYGCTSLKEVSLPNSLEILFYGSFMDCTALTRIAIPGNASTIETKSFSGCTGLKMVEIPQSVTHIGWGSFDGCTGLTDVYYLGTEEMWNEIHVGKDLNEPLLNANLHFGTEMPEPLDIPFGDVEESDYFAAPVLWAVENGITNGTGDGKFSPDRPCTRSQIVTFLWRAAGSPEPASSVNPFNDVDENAYYYKAVLWAVEKGITTGTGKGRFSPDNTCTRGQVATFLWRAQGEPKASTSQNPFNDVSPDSYYYEAILWAVEVGVTNGTGKGKFSPDNSCTRGQIVTFLYRALEKTT